MLFTKLNTQSIPKSQLRTHVSLSNSPPLCRSDGTRRGHQGLETHHLSRASHWMFCLHNTSFAVVWFCKNFRCRYNDMLPWQHSFKVRWMWNSKRADRPCVEQPHVLLQHGTNKGHHTESRRGGVGVEEDEGWACPSTAVPPRGSLRTPRGQRGNSGETPRSHLCTEGVFSATAFYLQTSPLQMHSKDLAWAKGTVSTWPAAGGRFSLPLSPHAHTHTRAHTCEEKSNESFCWLGQAVNLVALSVGWLPGQGHRPGCTWCCVNPLWHP